VKKANALKPVVDPELFSKAQARRKLELRGPHLSDEELLSIVRRCIDKYGSITGRNLLRENGSGRGRLQHRFGTLSRVYQIIGYDNRTKSPNWNERRRLSETAH
jgi:hypothetical protein